MKQLFSYTCLFPALIALVTVSAQEYKVSGTISGHNGKALEFIEVSLVSADSIAIVSDLTNDKGFFQLKAEKGTYTLLAENLGTVLFTKDIDINADMDLRKIIVENSIELSEAVITMSKPIFKQEYDKFIFNVENSPLKQGYDAMEVLKRSPKIQINSKGNILLRNQSVLVLANGRKMNMSGEELNNYLSGINSENIKSIEIQDVGSAETDASNSGGVVNIILKKPPTGFQSTVKTFYMHRNERNQVYFSGITNQFGSKKWNIYNRINYREDGNFNEYNSTLKFYENNSRNESEGKSNSKSTIFNTTTGIVFYPNDKHEIGTELYYVNNISDTKLNGNLQIFNPNLYAISTSDATSYFTYKTWDAIVNYTYKLDSLGSKVKLIADIGNNNTGNRNDVGIKYTYGILSDSKSRFLTNANSDFYNAQVDWNQKAKKKMGV